VKTYMRFNSIFALVPLVALSACSLDDLLPSIETTQPGSYDATTGPARLFERDARHQAYDAGQPTKNRTSRDTARDTAPTALGSTGETSNTGAHPGFSHTPNDHSSMASGTSEGGAHSNDDNDLPGNDATQDAASPNDDNTSPNDNTSPDTTSSVRDAGASSADNPTSRDGGAATSTRDERLSDGATRDTTDDSTNTACETFLNEGFANITTLVDDGWVMQNNSSPLGSTGWLQGDTDLFSAHEGDATSFIAANYANAGGAGIISNWLVTPEVPLNNGAVLAFVTRDLADTYADRLQVRMSLHGDSTNVGTLARDVGDFTELLLDVNATYVTSEYPNTFTHFELTIDGLARPTTGRLAFRYFVEDSGPFGSRGEYVAIDTLTYSLCPTDDTPSDAAGSDSSTSDEDEQTESEYHLVVSDGNNQSGLVGFSPNIAPMVRVLDGHGAPASGVEVNFAVILGQGAVTGDVQLSDVNGYAHPGKWTLGQTPGNNRLSAIVKDNPSETVSFSATGVTPGFNIQLQYITAISDEHKAVFEAARQRWEGLIIGDLPNVNLSLPANICGTHPALSGPIDDLTILVSVGPIDGANGVLGQAGPCVVRGVSGGLPAPGASGLPVLGMMQFDVEDVSAMSTSEKLHSVILHEMGHVLGISSVHWSGNNLLQNPRPNATSSDTHFSGARARQAFEAIGGTAYTDGTSVPVENCVGIPGCGAGTYNSHWREFVLDDELMTGYVSTSGTPNPLSRVTVASLWDIGYVVNLDGADPYSVNFSNLLGLHVAQQRTPLHELPYAGPLYVVDEENVVTLAPAF
jgi:hypothetical protein